MRHYVDKAMFRGTDPNFAEMSTAATELGRITGRIDVEDLLDAIFFDFCIGK